MKDRFKLSRFYSLLKKDYCENMRFNLAFIAIMIVMIFLSVTHFHPFRIEYSYLPDETMKSDYINHYKGIYIQIFWGLFMAFTLLYAFRSFRGIMQPSETLTNLMLPVSNPERYLLACFNSTVVIFVIYLLLFYAIASITNCYKFVGLKEYNLVSGGWFGNDLPQLGLGQEIIHTEVGNVFDFVSQNSVKVQNTYTLTGNSVDSFMPVSVWGIRSMIICCWLSVVSVCMWGAITFRKYAFLLTVLVHAFIILGFGFLGFLILGQMFEDTTITSVHLNKLTIYGSPENYQLPWNWLYWGWIFPVGYQWVIWLKLKHKQLV